MSRMPQSDNHTTATIVQCGYMSVPRHGLPTHDHRQKTLTSNRPSSYSRGLRLDGGWSGLVLLSLSVSLFSFVQGGPPDT